MAEKKGQKKSKKKPKDIVIEKSDAKEKVVDKSAGNSNTGAGETRAKKQRDERGRFVKGHEPLEGAGFQPGNLIPSKYQKKFCSEMLAFFDRVYAEGNYPTFEMFADEIKVTAATLANWAAAYPEFEEAYTACKNKQRGALLEGAMAGRFNATFAKFVAVNCHGMKEKVEVDDKHSGGFKISVDYFGDEEEQ